MRTTNRIAGAREIVIEDLDHSIAAGDLIWVDLAYPDPASLRQIEGSLSLGPLTVEDCLLPVRMPKLDLLPDGAFLAACSVQIDNKRSPRLVPSTLSVVIGPRHLLTIRRSDIAEVTDRLEDVFNDRAQLTEQTGAALAHAALDAMVDRHLPVMVRAAELAEDLEEQLDPQDERNSLEPLEGLIVLRRDLLAFRRLRVAQQEVLRRLGRRLPELRANLSDVADNQREAIDTAAATCDYIDGAIEAFRVGRDVR